MTEDRMRGWLRKPAQGSKRLQLVVETAGGLEPLADWDRDDVDNPPEGTEDVTALVLAQTREYTDAEGEKQKFVLRWLGPKGRVLKSTTHHAKPSPEPEEVEKAISDASIIRDLLTSLHKKDEIINRSLDTLQKGYDRSIEMLLARLETVNSEVADLRKQAVDETEAVAAEVIPEKREEILARTRAWDKLSDKLPEVFDLGIAALANKVLPPDGGDTPPVTEVDAAE